MFDEKDVMLNFWITDAEEEVLEKGMGSLRMLGGYAAGTTRDFQDEKMILKGMNFDYLSSNQGVINWDHNPRLIIGRPTHVGMLKKGLYVKGALSQKSDYPNPNHPDTQKALEQAEFAWDHAMRHKSNPSTVPPLAWSIEGRKVATRDGNIHKSMATAVALTDKAINPHDCTVSALAKSLGEAEKKETTELLIQKGFDPNDITNHRNYMLFCKSIGFSAEQSETLYDRIRSL